MTTLAVAITMQQAAKKLGIGPNILFRQLREAGVLHTHHGIKNMPRRQYIERGYFYTQNCHFTTGPYTQKEHIKPLVTPLGLSFIAEVLGIDEMDTKKPLASGVEHGPHREQTTRARQRQVLRLDTQATPAARHF